MSYIINVEWDRESASVGRDVDDNLALNVEGRVTDASPALASQRVYIAPKVGGVHHFVFLPELEERRYGADVIVNGVSFGDTKWAYAPVTEWGMTGDGSVTQFRAELPAGDPRVDELVKLAENVSV